MSEKTLRVGVLASGIAITSALLVWVVFQHQRERAPRPDFSIANSIEPAGNDEASVGTAVAIDDQRKATQLKLKALLQRRLDQRDARAHEAVLTFASDEAYRNFLARAGQAGIRLRGQLDRLRTVRVGYDSLDPLFGDMRGNPADYQSVDANYLVHVPGIPTADDRPKVNEVPFGNSSLPFLGVAGDHSQWGRGVTVAVLDTGVAADVTLGSGRIQYLDAGLGIMPGSGKEDGHGTAVAGLAAGAAPDAPGVASAANILSIRITGADGTGDSFTLAQGILSAVDAGARILNISMGSYSPSAVLTAAIDYASAQGAMIVAAAGNDGASQLQWPAADPRVISVGAVDALEQQVSFSNAGAQLKITAPGYGVDAAWLDGQRVSISGTSASTPLVAGAIASVMSTTPGLTAAQAWSVLQQYASDGGTPGPDPAYGNGILNLGWAMNRNDPTRVDTAIAGQYYDSATGMMNIVVQNRGTLPVSGLHLVMELGGASANHAVPPLTPGATFLVQTPVSAEQLAASGGLFYRTQLNNGSGEADQVPANNTKTGVILAPVK